MSLSLGSSLASKVYLGATEIKGAYLGATQVYTSFVSLLDLYPATAAHSAYDLGNKRGSVTESEGTVVNPVQRWRRDSDDALQMFTAEDIDDGTALDFANHGTTDFYGAPLYNGSSDYILFGDYVSTANSIGNCTISCYFMSNDVSVTQMIFAVGSNSLRTFIAGGNLRFGVSATLATGLSSKTLYFMELDVDSTGNCVEARLNGNIVNSATNASTADLGDLSIGCRSDGGTQDLFFDGFISDFSIGDRASVPLIDGDYDIDNDSYAASFDSVTTWPDGQATTTGKGLCCTGLDHIAAESKLIVANFGDTLEPPAAPYAPSLVYTDYAGDLIEEVDITSVIGSDYSIQGVAYDSLADSIFVASIEGKVFELDRDGVEINSFSLSNVNGLAYHSVNDTLLATVSNVLVELNKSTGAEIQRVSIAALTGIDHLCYKADTDDIWLSYGTNNVTGRVANIKLNGGIVNTFALDSTETRSVEGLTLIGDVLYVANDGYFHNTAATNTLQKFDITASTDTTISTNTSPATFTGQGFDAYLLTEYDQSGNDYDLTQTTAANQPLVVSGGVLVEQSSSPVSDFDGIDDCMRIPAADFITPTTALQVAAVVRNNNAGITTADPDLIISQWDYGTIQRSWLLGINADEKITVHFGDPANGTTESVIESDAAVTINELQVLAFEYDAGTVTIYRNGAAVASTTTFGASPVSLFNSNADVTLGCLLASNSPANVWDGQIGTIYLSDNLDSDIVDVQQKIMTQYGIS